MLTALFAIFSSILLNLSILWSSSFTEYCFFKYYLGLSPELLDVICHMMEPDHRKRPSVDEILRYKAVDKVMIYTILFLINLLMFQFLFVNSIMLYLFSCRGKKKRYMNDKGNHLHFNWWKSIIKHFKMKTDVFTKSFFSPKNNR